MCSEVSIYILVNTKQNNMKSITNTTKENNNETLEDILKERQIIENLTDKTIESYITAWNKYTHFQQADIHQLLTEAEADEETIIKLSKRRIKTRLTQFIIYLQQENYANNTIRVYVSQIKKLYKYKDIEVPHIKIGSNKNKETYKDLPTPDEIRKAIIHSRPKMKAVITFIASTGLRRSDVSNLTIADFVNATKEYHHNSYDLYSFIDELSKQSFIIPTWDITTQKNGINHITFSSHESTAYILQMLRERLMKKEVKMEDSLFELLPHSISRNFERLNERLGFGHKETRIRFHPHALRKFFGTTLTNNDVDYLSTQFLIGHTLNNVDSSYYFANPEKLKNKYLRVVDKLTFTMNMTYIDVESKEKRELSRLRQKEQEHEQKLKNIEQLLEEYMEKRNL